MSDHPITQGSVINQTVVPKRIVIDPITRIEGHLRIELQIENGMVKDAWSSTTMFRGLETILKGRDPREAWLFAQRICGVCTTVHAIASVRAVENALKITIPNNARLVRNLLEGAQFIQDHVIHFYNLHAVDWVDVVNALAANPASTSDLQKSISSWPNNSPEYFAGVQSRLQKLANSGQLGLFSNGYWGHPAYKLPPEVNLLAVAHYLEVLEWQRDVIKIQAVLGGKNPHPQTYLVGGMALPVDASSPVALNPASINSLRQLSQKALDFIANVYLPDLLAIAPYYPEWAKIGGGYGNFLSFGDFPTSTSSDPANLWLPRGIVNAKTISAKPAVLNQTYIREYVSRSWYRYKGGNSTGLHPATGETTPNFTGPQPPFDYLNVSGKYSWLKAPRYSGRPMEVGPLARVVVAYASGHAQTRAMVDQTLSNLKLGKDALFSTLGRMVARALETMMIAQKMNGWLDELDASIQSGDVSVHNATRWQPSSWPASASGWGVTEAPRGALGHWVSIQKGKISRYQMVVPSTWNGSPRDARGQRGPWEQALIGTPVADPQRPVEVLRVIHSFDPCMACAVHLVDANGRELTRVETY